MKGTIVVIISFTEGVVTLEMASLTQAKQILSSRALYTVQFYHKNENTLGKLWSDIEHW